MTLRLALITAALALGAAPAAADAPLTGADRARVEALDTAAGAALREALGQGAPADVAVLTDALAGAPRTSGAEGLLGEWSCRTIKLGKTTPLVVYQPFRCRATATDGTVTFEKLTGSQRVRGRVIPDEGTLLFVGVGYVAGDTPPAYDTLPEPTDTSAIPQRLRSPGVVEVVSDRKARILFPLPEVESTLDILLLER